MDQYSAYMRTGDGVWVGTHRLPLSSAITYCKEFRRHSFDCPVVIVPDGQDQAPLVKLVNSLHDGKSVFTRPVEDETVDGNGIPYPRGRCDTCGAPCDDKAGFCTEDPDHVVALA